MGPHGISYPDSARGSGYDDVSPRMRAGQVSSILVLEEGLNSEECYPGLLLVSGLRMPIDGMESFRNCHPRYSIRRGC